MRKTVFKKYVEEAEREDLIAELTKLYDSIPQVKNYFVMELGTEEDRKKIFDKAKKKLSGMYQRYRFRARKTKAKEVIKQVESISVFDHELADFYLYHAELCVQWLNWFNVQPLVWDHFMDSLRKGLELVLKSMSEDDFKDRIDRIVDLSDMGWDTQQAVVELLREVLGE